MAAEPVRTLALKEWAVIVRALLTGEQIVDVRKGGLREEGRHFRLRSRRLWLYPTAEHQHAEVLKAPYRQWLHDSPASPPGAPIRLDGWAEVVGVAQVTEPEVLARLDSRVIWTLEYTSARLRFKPRDALVVLALRAYWLREPITLDWRASYAGCTSWVDLEDAPEPSTLACEPALSDESFAFRLGLLQESLGVTFEVPEGVLESSATVAS